MTTNIFEKATRAKLRFDSKKGSVSVEVLWDMSLTDLDVLARGLRREISELGEDSFIKRTNPKLTELNLQFDVVKHVIEVRLAEKDESDLRAAKAEEKELIKQILAQRDREELLNLPKEELLAKLKG